MVFRSSAPIPLLLAALLLLGACTPSPPGPHGDGVRPAISPSPSDPHAAPVNVDQIGAIGDSLTAEMIDYDMLGPALTDAGWAQEDIRLDGVWGRPIDGAGVTSTSAVIDRWRTDGFDPRVWLIALGTNNSSDGPSVWQQDIRGVLNAINEGPAGNYTIYWVTIGYADADVDGQEAFAQTAGAIASEYPNVVVADYGAFLDTHRDDPDWELMWDDPVHHSKLGYQLLRTPFYLSTLAAESPS